MQNDTRELRLEHEDTTKDPSILKRIYKKEKEGQLNYLYLRCKAEEIGNEVIGDKIGIYSVRKEDKFKKLIQDSMLYEGKPFPLLTGNVVKIQRDNTIIAVYVKTSDEYVAHVVENHFRELKYSIYTHRVPPHSFAKIYNSQKELEIAMEELNLAV